MAWFKTNTEGSRKTIVSWGKNSPSQMFNLMIQDGAIRIEAGGCNVQSGILTMKNGIMSQLLTILLTGLTYKTLKYMLMVSLTVKNLIPETPIGLK